MAIRIHGSTTLQLDDNTAIFNDDLAFGSGDESVSEVSGYLSLVFMGTRPVIQANVQTLNKLIDEVATRRDNKTLPRVYIEVDNGNGYYRSELTNCYIEAASEYYDRIQRNAAPITLQFTRVNYWEGAETAVPLTNLNGSNNITGLNVYNRNDATGTAPNRKCNYVTIAGSSITGELPAPFRVEMVNNFNNTVRLGTLWMTQNVHSNPLSLDPNLAGYANIIESGSAKTKTKYWTLSTATLNACSGQWFKIMGGIATTHIDQSTWYSTALYFPSGGTDLIMLQKSEEVAVTRDGIHDLGTLQIPPWNVGLEDQTSIDLVLYVRKTGGFWSELSFAQLWPVTGFRELEPQGYGAAYGVRIADDGMNDTVWTDGWAGGGRAGHYIGLGERGALVPGRDQRLWFLQTGITGDIDAERVLSVKVFYRPRRMTI